MPEDDCFLIPKREYVDEKINALEERNNLKLKALQTEYAKSEGAYPTKEQLDKAMKDYCPTKEADRLSRNIDILIGVIISIFLLFVAAYVMK